MSSITCTTTTTRAAAHRAHNTILKSVRRYKIKRYIDKQNIYET